ncbi:MAG: hypothetical protein E7533_03375 [Ruminococcaceae bacterium]|nr:hypothetical protein [Oscillospiraceae bacterium]
MQYIQGLFQEIAALLLSILTLFGGVVTPSTNQIIKNIAPDTVIDFVLTGDTQVCDYMPEREANLMALAEDINNSDIELDAFMIVGDIAENGMIEEFDRVYSHICDFNVKNYVMVTGNHDIRLRDIDQAKGRFLDFMNSLNAEENAQNEIYFKYMVEDYTFLVMGSEKANFEDAFISDAQLQWLNIELKEATKTGKPVFVLCHYPLAESHGLPGTWGSANSDDVYGQLPTYEVPEDPDFTGSIGKQSEEVFDIISSYKNVIFITGHLHTGFGKNSYQVINEENNVIGINVPSVGINNKDGAYNNPGTGYFVEVTPDAVYFRARDFALGKNITDWDIVVDVK